MKTKMDRRSFVKAAAALGVGSVVFAQNLFAEGKKKKGAAGALPLVVPGEGMAKAVNYVNAPQDLKNDALKIERQGVKWGEQKCLNCQLYQPQADQDGKKVGKCALFASNLVLGEAWCSSWAKKA